MKKKMKIGTMMVSSNKYGIQINEIFSRVLSLKTILITFKLVCDRIYVAECSMKLEPFFKCEIFKLHLKTAEKIQNGRFSEV